MSYLKAFLENDIVIPNAMEKFMGKYYNNVLYNGIPWMIVVLYIIHYLFDVLVNALLKKMCFKEYVRIRLKKSLWYLGFYACSFLYCSATAWKNNIRFPHQYKFLTLDVTELVSGQLLAGYALLSAFYTSSFIWEGLQCSFSSFIYLFLTGFSAFTYFLRYIELVIVFTSTFSAVEFGAELIRCIYCTMKSKNTSKRLAQGTFCLYLIFFCVVYFIVLPINFLLPLMQGLLHNVSSITMIGLNLTIWGCFACQLYCSPLYRLMQHCWHHKETQSKVPECVGSFYECALFEPRDDFAYNLKIIKQEIQERREKVNALRQPKKKASVLFQTLKCMVVLNKKVKHRKEKKLNSLARNLEDSRVEENKSIAVVDEVISNLIENSISTCNQINDVDVKLQFSTENEGSISKPFLKDVTSTGSLEGIMEQ
ncbi:hypothetical protein FQA39_LY06426 [Lamprigera yunnana]|nr:hypothetical protein FQA39_LY06426 [Lamprigera yunnana]